MPQGKPNFLFFIADQLRADHLACYGNPLVRTPHIDGLAKAGWAAEAFYVASPICMPNRASLMTGRMPSRHGVRHNGIPLSLRATTFVELLRQAGYRTALVGKSHLQNMTGTKSLWPPKRLAVEATVPEDGDYEQESAPNWKDPAHEMSLPFYGFDTVHLTVEHGDEIEGHYRRWLRAKSPDAENWLGPKNAIPTPGLALTAARQAWRTRVPEEYTTNSYCAAMTNDFLSERGRDGQPFFLMCSFADPHHPFTPAGKYWDMYSPAEVSLPRSFHAQGNQPTPAIAALRAERDAGTAMKHTPAPFACTEQEAREALALNYGSITAIDDCVGRVLAQLEKSGLAEDTVVIFTSDHGDFMGDHQLLLKGPIHLRGLIRVPFLWRDPEGPRGARSASLAGTIDIAPTVLARARVAAFNGIEGKDLAPLISGATQSLHQDMLVEEAGQRVYMGFDAPVRMCSLVAGQYRLSLYDGVAWGELYDLARDPDELFNLWDDPASAGLRAELVLRLARKMLELGETSPYPSAIA
jgi:arylsulfatase A-like enzyme